MMCKSIFKKIVGAAMAVVVFGAGYGSVYANTDRALNGTWVREGGGEITFSDGNYEIPRSQRGTYTTNNRIVQMTTTHLHGGHGSPLQSDRWYSMAEAKEEVNLDHEGFSGFREYNYSVSGNTLTLITPETDTDDGFTIIYTRK